MLSDKKIDQLFREKLKDYEKDPPAFIWNNIEKQISPGKGKSNLLTIIAIAAAVLTLFLSGWWLTSSNNSNQTVSQSVAPSSTCKATSSDQKQKDAKVDSTKKFKPSAFSMATFAVKHTLPHKNNSLQSEGEEPVSLDVEKEVLSRVNSDEKILKKITSWLSSESKEDQADHKAGSKVEKVKDIPDTHQQELKDTKHRWSLGIQAGPVFTGGIKSLDGQKTKTGNTVSSGVIAGYNIGKRLSVRSGLVVSRIRQRTEIIDFSNSGQSSFIYSPSGKVNISQPINPQNGIQSQLKQELSYIGIPVLVNYKIVNKKFSVGVTGGVNANLLTGNKAELTDNQGNGETSNIRDVAWSGELGLEMGYDIGKRITITVEPHLKRYINSLSSNPSFNIKPYQAGLYTGVTYSFN